MATAKPQWAQEHDLIYPDAKHWLEGIGVEPADAQDIIRRLENGSLFAASFFDGRYDIRRETREVSVKGEGYSVSTITQPTGRFHIREREDTNVRWSA